MYTINYIDGNPVSIKRNNSFIPFNVNNTDFAEFLKWNKKHKLDYETQIAVEPQEQVETLEEKITRIAKVVAKDEISKDALLK